MHTPEQIIATVAAVTGVSPGLIKGRIKRRRISYARTLAMAMIRKDKSWWSLMDIAAIFNRTSHQTITAAIHRHDWLEKESQPYRTWTIAIEHQLFTTAAR